MKRFCFLLIVVPALFFCGENGLFSNNEENIVYGCVKEAITEKRIQKATIVIEHTQLGSSAYVDSTDGGGNYRVENIRPGILEMRVSAQGYFEVTISKHHEGGKTLRDFHLTPDTLNAKYIVD